MSVFASHNVSYVHNVPSSLKNAHYLADVHIFLTLIENPLNDFRCYIEPQSISPKHSNHNINLSK